MSRKRLSTADRVRIFTAADGVCHLCDGKITTGQKWEVSHPTPIEMGGADDDMNRRPAHKKCHATQTATVDIPQIAKAKRRQARHIGARKRTGFKGWRRFSGEIVWARDGSR
jgi:5-methylcytosine-specific restriction protein A